MSVFAFKITISKSDMMPEYLFKDTDTINNREHTVHNTEERINIAPTGILTFFTKYKKFSFLLIGIAMLFYSQNLIWTYLINIIENVGGNSADMGISLAITAALELPTMAGFIFLVRKIKCNSLIKISAFFFLLKVILALFAQNVYTIHLSQALQMFAYALFTPAAVYYVNSIIEKQDKVKGQSMLGVAMCVAGTIANITGGKILDTVGVTSMLLLGTVVTACGFVIVCVSTEKAVVPAF
jgi:PPP family 3-phenylpropionic acid transporter